MENICLWSRCTTLELNLNYIDWLFVWNSSTSVIISTFALLACINRFWYCGIPAWMIFGPIFWESESSSEVVVVVYSQIMMILVNTSYKLDWVLDYLNTPFLQLCFVLIFSDPNDFWALFPYLPQQIIIIYLLLIESYSLDLLYDTNTYVTD